MRCVRKKTEPTPSPGNEGGAAHSLEVFHKRLRDLCQNNAESAASERHALIQAQAEQAIRLADEYGILKIAAGTAAEFRADEAELIVCSEHMVDFDSATGRVFKLTNPPGFGLIPFVHHLPVIDLQNPWNVQIARKTVEFRPATPLEYLERWMDANELFRDDVGLISVVKWTDGFVSFGVSQPQYHGQEAEPREIESYFIQAGWTPIPDSTSHRIFYNYNWQVMAIDAEPRNCYINEGLLLPFDVLLCRPDKALEAHLGLYPTGPSSSPSGT